MTALVKRTSPGLCVSQALLAMRHPINSLAPGCYLNNNEPVTAPKMVRTFHFPRSGDERPWALFFLKNT